MNRFRLGRPSPAMVVACTALFISLSGVSYGVATGAIDSRELKNNTVRSKDIRNNTIHGRDIRRNGVFGSDVRQATLTGADVRNASLTGADVRNNALTGTDIEESSLGQVPNASTLDGIGPSGFLRTGTRATEATTATATDYANQASLVSLGLAAGQYALVAKVAIDNGGAAGTIRCELDVGGTTVDQMSQNLAADGAGPAERMGYSLSTAVAPATATTAAIQCDQNGGSDATDARIVAIKLD